MKIRNYKLEIRNSRSGFTLVELLIFMALFSVILLVLTTLFATIVQQQLETQGQSAVESDATFLSARFQYDFDQAQGIVLPAASGDTETSLTLDVGGQDVTYALNGTVLELTTPSGTQALTSPRTVVSSLSFQRIGNESGVPTIRIQITLSSLATTAQGPEVHILDTIYAPR